jgi:hypothetical protein
MSEPGCPICRILQAAQGQRLDVFLRLMRVAHQMRCQCPDVRHTPLLAHPHRRLGCVGYVPLPIEIVGSISTVGEEEPCA